MDESRFDRIETKIDKLTEVVSAVVRVEEQLLANNKRVDRIEQRNDTLEAELDLLSKVVANNSGTVKFADKLFWIVLGGVIGFLSWLARAGVSG